MIFGLIVIAVIVVLWTLETIGKPPPKAKKKNPTDNLIEALTLYLKSKQ